MRNHSKRLFDNAELSDVLRHRHERILAEIEALTSEYVLKANVDELTAHLAEKYSIEPLSLDSQHIVLADHGDTKIDKTHDPRYAMGINQRVMVPATYVEYAVPFIGDSQLFDYRPSTHRTSSVNASIHGNELRFRYEAVGHDAQVIRRSFESALETVTANLGYSRQQLEAYNRELAAVIKPRIEARRTKFLKDKGLAESLGYPIRPRTGVELTYPAPVQRKRFTIPQPKVSAEPFHPEPVLEMEVYGEILAAIENMALVFERNPAQFVNMDEETMRTHILVPLNAQFAGAASGETFNGEGKTDILIRADNKTIFIAECKIWKGADSFRQSIDQLLSYTTWRDAKTAIVLLSRNKNTSSVLSQIPQLVKSHPSYKSDSSRSGGKDRLQYWLSNKNDVAKLVLMTVLVLDVPK